MYTSYFGNRKNIINPLSITAKKPYWFSGPHYPKLGPKESFLKDYKDGIIYGHFRTAGVLALMIASIMKASNIIIVGMDGYTLYDKKELKKGNKSHHSYGKGYTDDASWKDCLNKDAIVNQALHDLHDYGINFEIATPTKFSDFYNNTLL